MLGVTEHGKGHIAVYGDSNCLDSSHMRTPCFRLLSKLLTYVATVRHHIHVHGPCITCVALVRQSAESARASPSCKLRISTQAMQPYLHCTLGQNGDALNRP